MAPIAKCYLPTIVLNEQTNESQYDIGDCCADYGITLKPVWYYFVIPFLAEMILIFYNQKATSDDAMFKEPTDWALIVFMGYTALNITFLLLEFDYDTAENSWEVYQGLVFLFANSTGAIALLVTFQAVMVKRMFPFVIRSSKFLLGSKWFNIRLFRFYEDEEDPNLLRSKVLKEALAVKYHKGHFLSFLVLLCFGGATHALPMMLAYSPLFVGCIFAVVISHSLRLGRFDNCIPIHSAASDEDDSNENDRIGNDEKMLFAFLSVIVFPFVLVCVYLSFVGWWIVFIPVFFLCLVILFVWYRVLFFCISRGISKILRKEKKNVISWLNAKTSLINEEIEAHVNTFKATFSDGVNELKEEVEMNIDRAVEDELNEAEADEGQGEFDNDIHRRQVLAEADEEKLRQMNELDRIEELLYTTTTKSLRSRMQHALEEVKHLSETQLEELEALETLLHELKQKKTWVKFYLSRSCIPVEKSTWNARELVHALKMLRRQLRMGRARRQTERDQTSAQSTQDLSKFLREEIDSLENKLRTLRNEYNKRVRELRAKWRERRLKPGVKSGLKKLQRHQLLSDLGGFAQTALSEDKQQLRESARAELSRLDEQLVRKRRRNFIFERLMEFLKKLAVYDAVGNVILLGSGMLALIFALSVNYGVLMYSGLSYRQVITTDFWARDSLRYLDCALQFKTGFAIVDVLGVSISVAGGTWESAKFVYTYLKIRYDIEIE